MLAHVSQEACRVIFNIIHKSQKLEIIPISINSERDKSIVTPVQCNKKAMTNNEILLLRTTWMES